MKQELISKRNPDEFHAKTGYIAKLSSFSFMLFCCKKFPPIFMRVLLKEKEEVLMGNTYTGLLS